jgi:hypothetical protein
MEVRINMKRGLKMLTILVVLLALGAVGAWAKGPGGLRLGLEFGNPNAVLIIRPAPLDFRIGYNFAAPGYLFLSADYRIVDAYQIVDFLHFFFGLGAYTKISFEPTEFSLGARIPLGLQAFLLNNVLELFLEVAPTVGFLPTISAFPEWQGYIGFTIRIPR